MTMDKELELIRSPDKWPMYPVLTVVNHDPEHYVEGLIYVGEGSVVFIHAYEYSLKRDTPKTRQERLEGCERRTYASFELLLREWSLDEA
jgi:hypothetical protein